MNLKLFTAGWLLLAIIHVLPAKAQDSLKAPIATANSPTIKNNPGQYFKPAKIIVPVSFLLYSGLKAPVNKIQQWDNEIMTGVRKNNPGFKTTADDYLMWAPSASIYLMDALQVKTRHTFAEHLILDAGSLIIAGGVGYVMRKVSGNIDVYKSQGTKFPSGHTTNAFRGAAMVREELKDSHQLLSYSGYLVATAVGVMRIYNKAHYLTEVLAGAGLGILSAKLSYWIFDKANRRRKK